MIAKETGWSREFIHWDLPVWEGDEIIHCSLIAAGQVTQWVDDRGDSDWVEETLNIIDSYSKHKD